MQRSLRSVMRATDFEYRHQRLVHQFIVGASVLTYLIDRDDVVWRFVRDSVTPHRLERLVFIVATVFIALGAGICTWARARSRLSTTSAGRTYRYLDQLRYLGELCYAIGLASLVPFAGFFILVGGEALRILRLILRDDEHGLNYRRHPMPEPSQLAVAEDIHFRWGKASRQEAVKWGILITMIVFVITLQDRHADVLAVASFILGNLLNVPLSRHSTDMVKYPADHEVR